MKIILMILGMFWSLNLVAAEPGVWVAHTNYLTQFTTDGCSLFPEGTLTDPLKWEHCCVLHDVKYWQGGTRQDRLNADKELAQCVATTGEPKIAKMMLMGVRAGGAPAFSTSFRWGYGWIYDRRYLPLGPDELNQVESLTPNNPLNFPIQKPRRYVNNLLRSVTGNYCLDKALVSIANNLGQGTLVHDVKFREERYHLNGYDLEIDVKVGSCNEPVRLQFRYPVSKGCQRPIASIRSTQNLVNIIIPRSCATASIL